MRKIVAFDRVTADGYFAAADGNLDWVVPDDQVDQAGASAIPGFDTVLFGRKTYEMFAGFWPHALESPNAQGPHGGKLSGAMRAMAVFLNEATKLVFSRTLKEKDLTWKNSRLLPKLDPREVEALKKGSGKDMIVFGSGSVVSELARHGLVDEYQLVVCPVVLGSGRTLLSGVPKSQKVKLLESKSYASGNVMLRYARGS
jgi:dihydrofolate reductase